MDENEPENEPDFDHDINLKKSKMIFVEEVDNDNSDNQTEDDANSENNSNAKNNLLVFPGAENSLIG